jgi:multiple sugar transport system substrate-binding protein
MGRRGFRFVGLAAIPVLVLSACNSTVATPTPSSGASAAQSAAPTPSAPPGTIRWFVGLDQGTDNAQVAAEKQFVAGYNSANKDGITIRLEVVPSTTAADVLKKEMAAGSAPDIVGPIGIGDLNGFEDLFLDLGPQMQKNNIDMTAYDPALVKFLQQGRQGQIGLPYLIFPGYIWYDRDIFTKAKLPDLPTSVGDKYQGQTWDWNQLAKIGAQLTVDKLGRKPSDVGFDPKTIVQYGFDFQWNDLRRMASCFGSGSFVAGDGKTAQVPAVWADAVSWYYAGIWGTSPFIPNGLAEAGALLGQGNVQSSGAVAMNVGWTTSIPSIATDAATSKVKDWGIAVMPSWKGTTTSPMYADTFAITKASANPDAAFKVMMAIMADQTLLRNYGGEPAKTNDQPAYFANYDQILAPIFPGIKVSWSVLEEMQKYPAVPTFEANMPAFAQAQQDYTALLTKLQTTPGLDVVAELTKLQTKLQTDFDSAQPLVKP